MDSQIYNGLSLISAILWNFRVAGENGFIFARWANIVFFYPIGQKKVTAGPLFRPRNECVTKRYITHLGRKKHSCGAYTIFYHTQEENTTFGSESGTFGQGMVKKYFFLIIHRF